MAKNTKDDGLTKKERRKYFWMNILTFGALKRKALQRNQTRINEIQPISGFDLTQFFSALGSEENFINSKLLSDNSLQCTLRYVEKVQIEPLKQITNAIGVMKSNNTITLLTKNAKFLDFVLNGKETIQKDK